MSENCDMFHSRSAFYVIGKPVHFHVARLSRQLMCHICVTVGIA